MSVGREGSCQLHLVDLPSTTNPADPRAGMSNMTPADRVDAQDQFTAGMPVAKSDLQPGDLVFYAHNNGTGRIHQVGMYVGDGT
jgi:hypothetical protein